jgi:oxygen-independent coproporphyrinogen-3 oxidase
MYNDYQKNYFADSMKYDTSVDTRSLYIHWPFCPYKCHFCPFVALASHDQFMQQYHEALRKEIIDFAESVQHVQALDTIFIGGGTPSTYPIPLLLDTFATLRRWFSFNKECEITLEVNPGTVTDEKLHGWRQAGISRLSIGVQSLKDEVLTKLNRLQTSHDVYALLASAKDLFKNISIDLIVGLPGVSMAEWQEIVHEVVTWPITHVSVYFLSVHENTPLYFGVKAKKIKLPCDDEVVESYYWTVALLKSYGFMQYEISNFAQQGYESRHNTVYWERKPYKGFGLGACSFDGKRRFQNQKNLTSYLHGTDHTPFVEELTREQIHLEKIMLGMRRAGGVTRAELYENLSPTEIDKIVMSLEWLRDNKFIIWTEDRIVLTPAGLAVENEIVVKLSL